MKRSDIPGYMTEPKAEQEKRKFPQSSAWMFKGI